MIYSHASRYLTSPSPIPDEKPSDILSRFAPLLHISRLGSDTSRNILIIGDGSGYSAALLLQNILIRSSVSAGIFFNADESLWADDVRKMIRLPNGFLSKDAFCAYVERFRSLVEPEETAAGYVLPASVRRVLFAGFVFTQEMCSVCILDDSDATASYPDYLASSEFFLPTFSLLTGTSGTETRQSPAFLPRAIRKGTREVVSNLFGQALFQHVSGLCAAAGCRLQLPVRNQYERLSLSCQGTRFNYRDTGPYRIGTLSEEVLQNALAVLELVGVLRRYSFAIPPEAVTDSLSAAPSPSCFSLMSLRPTAYAAHMRTLCDADMLIKTLESLNAVQLVEPSVVLCTDLPPDVFLRFHTSKLQIEIATFPVYPDATTLSRQKKLDAEFVRSLLAERDRSFVFAGDFRFLARIEQSFHH